MIYGVTKSRQQMGPESIFDTIQLQNGILVPVLGIGTWGMHGLEDEAVIHALNVGYRHIDTAKIYGTEVGIGNAIKASGVPREKLFITTKLWNEDQGYGPALSAIDESLQRLDMDYVDLYLIHWPLSHEREGKNRRAETWSAMEKIYESGKAKAIGVSNYEKSHMEEMQRYAKIMPMVNQIERHPFYQQNGTANFCRALGIVVTDYSPLTRGKRTSEAPLEDIANKHEKSSEQVLLRWGLQHGDIVIPKSGQRVHIEANADIFDFQLDDEDMAALDALDEGLSVV